MSDLSLVDLGLTAIPEDAVKVHSATATTVNLSENNIRDASGLAAFRACETLILDKNGLEGLEGFPTLPSVTTLWFNKNNVSDLAEFMDQVFSTFPNLVYLSCMGNPASPPLVLISEEDVSKSKRYRLYVIYRLPKLQFLDSSPVTPEERSEAVATGQFLVVRKPKKLNAAPSPPTSESDASAMFFGGTSTASARTVSSESKKGGATLGVGTSHYDGRHSEGNRFIIDRDL